MLGVFALLVGGINAAIDEPVNKAPVYEWVIECPNEMSEGL
jgi:hypothetical protein